MNKQNIHKTRDVSFYCGKLSEFVEELNLVEKSLIDSGATDISISLEIDREFGDENTVIRFSYYILETDDEYNKRLSRLNYEYQNKLEQFERLKKELGK